MTCIAGLVTPSGRVYIGADSAGVGGQELTIRRDRKVFRNGDFLIGFTSSFRMGQLLRYTFSPPEHPDDMEVERYMVTLFADAIRDCLKAGGFARKNSEQEQGGTFLVGYRGRLFAIESDYQVGEALEGYDAIGCGRGVAVGSLFTTAKWGPSGPERRVTTALEAAEMLSSGVRSPFHIESIE